MSAQSTRVPTIVPTLLLLGPLLLGFTFAFSEVPTEPPPWWGALPGDVPPVREVAPSLVYTGTFRAEIDVVWPHRVFAAGPFWVPALHGLVAAVGCLLFAAVGFGIYKLSGNTWSTRYWPVGGLALYTYVGAAILTPPDIISTIMVVLLNSGVLLVLGVPVFFGLRALVRRAAGS